MLGLREEPLSLRTQYQVQNNTQTRKNQKGFKKNKDELVDKNYPTK